MFKKGERPEDASDALTLAIEDALNRVKLRRPPPALMAKLPEYARAIVDAGMARRKRIANRRSDRRRRSGKAKPE
jgi:hypothetical protein